MQYGLHNQVICRETPVALPRAGSGEIENNNIHWWTFARVGGGGCQRVSEWVINNVISGLPRVGNVEWLTRWSHVGVSLTLI